MTSPKRRFAKNTTRPATYSIGAILLAIPLLTGCSGSQDQAIQQYNFSDDCSPEDFGGEVETYPLREDCGIHTWSKTIHPSGALVNGHLTRAVADPYLAAKGAYGSYSNRTDTDCPTTSATPLEYVETHACHAAERFSDPEWGPSRDRRLTLGDDEISSNDHGWTYDAGTFGDYLSDEQLSHPISLEDGVILEERWNVLLWSSNFSVASDDSVTYMHDLASERWRDGTWRLEITMPGDIIETNGMVQGRTAVWEHYEGQRVYVKSAGFNPEFIQALRKLND